MLYIPKDFPQEALNQQELIRHLQEELASISKVVNYQALMLLDTTNVVPDKPREGMVRFADGTNWNPGSGKGFYGYYTGAWHLLG